MSHASADPDASAAAADHNHDNSHDHNLTGSSAAAHSDAASISTFAYFNSNASVISYDSILTNERILDRLDLSPDDEVLLQQVLQEEKQQKKQEADQQTAPQPPRDSRVICVPASQFPSLKVRQVPEVAHSNNSTESIRQLLEKDFTFRDKSLAAQVEQHYASTSRYSYIVEEAGDDDYMGAQDALPQQIQGSGTSTPVARSIANVNNAVLQGNTQHPHPDLRAQRHPSNASVGSYQSARSQHSSIPNFERYRVDNARLSAYAHGKLPGNRKNSTKSAFGGAIGAPSHHNRNYQQLGNTFAQSGKPPEQYGFPRDHTTVQQTKDAPYQRTDPMYDSATSATRPAFATRGSYRFNSSTTTTQTDTSMSRGDSAKSDVEPPSVSSSRGRTPYGTPMISQASERSSENVSTITTPKKGTRDIDSPTFTLEQPLERPASHKTHKKKSSLTSFKNLFKTPKSKKNHSKEELVSKTKSNSEVSSRTKDLPAKESSSSLDLTSSNSSVENSPSLGKSNLRKFIFPPNPNLHFDAKGSHNKNSHNNIMYKDNHYRSLSDMNKPNSIGQTAGSTSLQASPSRIKTHKHSVSTQSGEAVLYLDNTKIIDLANNKISTGLSDVSSQDTAMSEEANPPRANSPISLSMSLKENILKTPQIDGAETKNSTAAASPVKDVTPETDVAKPQSFNSNPLITSAINMRIEGKLEASAAKLRRACQEGDRTAFLLYGLALRHGCGVPEDQTMSLTFIMKATGIDSFQDEVYSHNIDPLRL